MRAVEERHFLSLALGLALLSSPLEAVHGCTA